MWDLPLQSKQGKTWNPNKSKIFFLGSKILYTQCVERERERDTHTHTHRPRPSSRADNGIRAEKQHRYWKMYAMGTLGSSYHLKLKLELDILLLACQYMRSTQRSVTRYVVGCLCNGALLWQGLLQITSLSICPFMVYTWLPPHGRRQLSKSLHACICERMSMWGCMHIFSHASTYWLIYPSNYRFLHPTMGVALSHMGSGTWFSVCMSINLCGVPSAQGRHCPSSCSFSMRENCLFCTFSPSQSLTSTALQTFNCRYIHVYTFVHSCTYVMVGSVCNAVCMCTSVLFESRKFLTRTYKATLVHTHLLSRLLRPRQAQLNIVLWKQWEPMKGRQKDESLSVVGKTCRKLVTCMQVHCPCLRVRSVGACLPCLFSLHTVQVAILLRSDIALARVFKGAPMHKREHPAELMTVVIFHSPGDQTPNPPFCRVLLLSVCLMLWFTQRASFCPTSTPWQA